MMTVTHESAWMLMHMARLIQQINDVVEDHAAMELYIDKDGCPQISWVFTPVDGSVAQIHC